MSRRATVTMPELFRAAGPRPMTELCPTHLTPLKLYCPVCRGSRGGRVASPEKQKASRENLELARAIRKARKAGQVEKP